MDMYVGDTLKRSRDALTNHVGVYLGHGRVFHLTPGNGVHISDFTSFSNHQAITVTNNNLDPKIVFERVRQLLNEHKAYALLTNNCDHAVSFVTKGYKFSAQVLIFSLCALGACYFIAKKKG